MKKTNRSRKLSKVSRSFDSPAEIILENKSTFSGIAIGARKKVVGELCFNTSMTGYQEIISDPSYAGQIINFTFPHIGNVGTNSYDNETFIPFASGIVVSADISEPSNFRSIQHLDSWLKENNIPGICNVDTRSITNLIRENGAYKCLLNTKKNDQSSLRNNLKLINDWNGLNNLDLAREVSCKEPFTLKPNSKKNSMRIIAIDYGIKHNIVNSLMNLNAEVIIVPATSNAEMIMSFKPDGIFLSNGPGDPKATGKYAIPTIKKLIETKIPMFGICLGHQLISLALGAKTKKMFQGHRGANHPVKNLTTNQVEITSQNHGFVVEEKSIPKSVSITHKSLFDGSVEGIKHKNKKVFSVQYHPEASPGPHDSHYLFQDFISLIKDHLKYAKKKRH
mgnify:CR=1 FL=1